MSNHNTVCAGIDTGKHKLDIAFDGSAERLQVDNSSQGHRTLSAWLRQREVERIGIEASGGYEQAAVSSLRADGFVVVVFQPAQVRAYAKFVLQHAKNDAIDAALIARCTAAATDIREPPDARLALLAQHLTMIEQLTEDVGQLKTRREACREERIREFWKREINRLKVLLSSELKQLVVAIREHRDLSDRLDLIASVDGVGLRTAVAILVRMPEIGRVTREQAAAIVGLAPYDNDSGLRHGSRQSRAAVSDCGKVSTRLPCRLSFTGTLNCKPSTSVSLQPESRTRLLSSLVLASSSSSLTPSWPAAPLGRPRQRPHNGCSA